MEHVPNVRVQHPPVPVIGHMTTILYTSNLGGSKTDGHTHNTVTTIDSMHIFIA